MSGSTNSNTGVLPLTGLSADTHRNCDGEEYSHGTDHRVTPNFTLQPSGRTYRTSKMERSSLHNPPELLECLSVGDGSGV